MIGWIREYAGTAAVSLLLIALAAWIVVRLRKDKKQGRHTCGGNCGCCPMSGSCHKSS